MLSRLLDDGVLTCPVCRGPTDDGLRNAPLELDSVYAETVAGEVLQGQLRCSACGTRYPVIDGVACVFSDTRAWLRREERAVMGRSDLHPALAGFLSEAWGESEDPSWRRQLLSVYGRRLPGMMPTGPAESVMARLQEEGDGALDAARERLVSADDLVLDAGCGVGVGSLALVEKGARVVAFDQDFTALRLLGRLLRDGVVEVPTWGAGGADFGVQQAVLEDRAAVGRVALVAGDVLDPPFAGGVFDGVVAMNLLDNVAEPVMAVRQLHGMVRKGGRLLVASPFDWAERATARGARLGDGLRLSDGATDPVPVLHALLEGRLLDVAPEVACEVTQAADVPWVLVRHDRSAHVFVTHVVEAVRAGGIPSTNGAPSDRFAATSP